LINQEFLTKPKHVKAHWSYARLYSISGTR